MWNTHTVVVQTSLSRFDISYITDRTVQTQHSWLHGFSGCVFYSVRSNLERDMIVLLRVLHTPGNVLLAEYRRLIAVNGMTVCA